MSIRHKHHRMLPEESTDNNTNIRWIHVADASLRIEAILSGQAVLADTQTVAVQPPSTASPPDYYYTVVPVPHTVVVIKHDSAISIRPRSESRTRRAGRISRQFMEKYFTNDPEEDDCKCCASLFSLHRSPRFIGTPVLC
jgi:hypothetical protein